MMLTNLLPEGGKMLFACASVNVNLLIFFILPCWNFKIFFFTTHKQSALIFLRCNFCARHMNRQNAKESEKGKNFNVERSKSFIEEEKSLIE